MIRFFLIIVFFPFMGLASQEQIVQKVSERFPTFGYNSNKGKVVWIDFPIEIIIRNKTNSDLFANSASYYGYVKHFDIHHKRWDYRLLYICNKDSIIGYVDNDGCIYPGNEKEYLILTRHPMNEREEFQKLFKDIIEEKSRNTIGTIWKISPSILSDYQKRYLRGMISNDSIRIKLYSEEKNVHYINMPIDVDKVLPEANQIIGRY